MSLTDRNTVYLKYNSQNSDTPDVADGARIQVFGAQVRRTVKKDVKFIPKPRPPGSYKEGQETLALDFLKLDNGWSITGRIYGKGDRKHSLPDGFTDSNGDGTVTSQNVSFNDFESSPSDDTSRTWHLLGATKIKHGSETVKNSSNTTLTRGTDYGIDYNRGLIELYDTVDTTLGETYTIDYTYNGRNDNIARVLQRMAERGGNVLLEFDRNSYTQSSGEQGAEYMVHTDTIEFSARSDAPDEIEVSIEAREAIDRL